jgi:hypothetical protein
MTWKDIFEEIPVRIISESLACVTMKVQSTCSWGLAIESVLWSLLLSIDWTRPFLDEDP